VSRILTLLGKLFFFLIFPGGVFWVGYCLTDLVFQAKKIPFPFEYFGIAIGCGFFAWTLALVVWVQSMFKNRRPAS